MNRPELAIIGFGEAGIAFARPGVAVYDRKTADPATRDAKRADYRTAGVAGFDAPDRALEGADTILCLVTADQSRAAANTCASSLAAGACWFDMNSVAPATKRETTRAIEAVGGRYVDAAVMSPVNPSRLATPLLLSGHEASEGAAQLRAYGFTDVRVVGERIGDAASIKMIRSVMMKGIEALTAECLLAAEAAGVTAEVVASLEAGTPAGSWLQRSDYNLDRMMVHGLRRAAEMEEVVKTLDALGLGAAMTRGTVTYQRAIGSLGLADPPRGLAAKLGAIGGRSENGAA